MTGVKRSHRPIHEDIVVAGQFMSNKDMRGYYYSLTNVQSGLMSLLVEVIKTSNDGTLRRMFKVRAA